MSKYHINREQSLPILNADFKAFLMPTDTKTDPYNRGPEIPILNAEFRTFLASTETDTTENELQIGEL